MRKDDLFVQIRNFFQRSKAWWPRTWFCRLTCEVVVDMIEIFREKRLWRCDTEALVTEFGTACVLGIGIRMCPNWSSGFYICAEWTLDIDIIGECLEFELSKSFKTLYVWISIRELRLSSSVSHCVPAIHPDQDIYHSKEGQKTESTTLNDSRNAL
ncbi:hypothetical protein ABG067_006825 [Albugo candida]